MEKTKNLNSIDFSKFVLCIGVVAIHTMGRFGFYPFLRIAVPMFFCISSYLFFRKLNGFSDRLKLKNFIYRNIKLYFFWLGILIVPTLLLGGWLEGNLVYNFIKFCFKIVLGSTFPASWYIPALIISITLVYYVSKYISDKLIFCFGLLVYIFCCLASTYRGILSEESIAYQMILAYPGTIYNSFPVGIMWVCIGKYFASDRHLIEKRKLYVAEVVSLILLVVEYQVALTRHWIVDNDCMLMLVPVCFLLMSILLNVNVQMRDTIPKIVRNLSTVIYCLHGTIAELLKVTVFKGRQTLVDSFELFAFTLCISSLVALLILWLEKKRGLVWLKYAH